MGRQRFAEGSSLLEVVMAMLIFSTVSTVFLTVWVYHARAQEKSAHFLVASNLAESLMEKAIALGYDGVNPGTTSETIPMITTAHGDAITVKYKWSQVVADQGAAANKERSVVVAVYWSDTTHTGEVRLDTLLSGRR